MNETKRAISYVLSLLPLTVIAQQTPAPAAAGSPLTYISAPEVAAQIAKAETAVKAGSVLPASARALPSWGPFVSHVVYRNASTELYFANDDFAEFYVILEGEGTMTIGSTLINPKRT